MKQRQKQPPKSHGTAFGQQKGLSGCCSCTKQSSPSFRWQKKLSCVSAVVSSNKINSNPVKLCVFARLVRKSCCSYSENFRKDEPARIGGVAR
eukprot:5304524-Amphidinium_carterae.1